MSKIDRAKAVPGAFPIGCSSLKESDFIAFTVRTSRGFLTNARASSASFGPYVEEALRFPTERSARAFVAINCPSLSDEIVVVPVRCSSLGSADGRASAWR